MSSNEDPKLSGPLADLRNRGDGFRTPPPAYFDELAQRALKGAARPPAVTRRLYQPWMAIAASLIVLLVATFLLWPASNGQLLTENREPITDYGQPKTENRKGITADEILADIDPVDIEAYISDDLENFEAELYADNN